ncbi:sodium:solute symporter family protein [Pseudalkalibacillus hwajinpoensis]|uniref:Sodium:solute symporter n=1 Tax=Guptibacillus hwajinpoensis TaxID=208199 RepID=A0A4U1MDF9_9BACL|nr:sodium:solute symporter family protein [Pseudalkalibacillus hwajinpoensis]TKD69219.1 sodium:solute symporter [Pseudalkalibacillus hwajinpoensis]
MLLTERKGSLLKVGIFVAAIVAMFVYLGMTNININWGSFIAMLAFYAVIYYIGAFMASNKSESASDMMVAKRSLPLWISMFTMAATWVGGGYISGTAESTYSFGLAWAQAPWGYALSLIIGGIFYARKMRRYEFMTMIDPLEQRFGKKVAGVLYIPALLGEVFWSGAILTALGTTFGTILGLDFQTSIILSAVIAIAYTVVGGMWSVAFTDVFQMLAVMIGLFLVLPFALSEVGGLTSVWSNYQTDMGSYASLFPPLDGWTDPAWGNYYWNWWDFALLLILGGIPWQVYFQRVLSAKTEKTAMWLSITAGFVCIIAAVPAVIIGAIGLDTDWASLGVNAPDNPAMILPYVLQYLTPDIIGAIGLGALAAAVMSSMDSSILSASSMAAWNLYRPLFKPNASSDQLKKVIKRSIILVGIAATIIALNVQSVYALWYLAADLVYVILFPQLTTALFFKGANKYGSIAGLIVSFFLRIGGGEPMIGLPIFLPYPMIEDGLVLFPFRTLAMVSGLLTIIVVSKLTKKACPPKPLLMPAERENGNEKIEKIA